jgi:RND superfamily putative drug exporter
VVLGVAGFGVLGFGAFGKLQTGGFLDPGAQSTAAQTLTSQRFGGSAGVVLLVHAVAGTMDGAPTRAAGAAAAARRLAAVPGVSNVVSDWAGAQSRPEVQGRQVRAGVGQHRKRP